MKRLSLMRLFQYLGLLAVTAGISLLIGCDSQSSVKERSRAAKETATVSIASGACPAGSSCTETSESVSAGHGNFVSKTVSSKATLSSKSLSTRPNRPLDQGEEVEEQTETDEAESTATNSSTATITSTKTATATATSTSSVSEAQIRRGQAIYLANCGVGGFCHTSAKNGPGNTIDNRSDQAITFASQNVPGRPIPINLTDEQVKDLGAYLRAP